MSSEHTREAMQALLAGKRLISYEGNGEPTIAVLAADYVRDVRDSCRLDIYCWDTWQIYEEPNPHKAGTFAWAREEAKRGKRVRQSWWTRSSPGIDQAWFDGGSFMLKEIDATDWEIVK